MSSKLTPDAIASDHTPQYIIGITLLTLALIFSSLLGLAQDAAYTKYGRGHWEEGLFYMHFLSLPMFAFLLSDIQAQIHDINTAGRYYPVSLAEFIPLRFAWLFSHPRMLRPGMKTTTPFLAFLQPLITITVPRTYVPLILNVVTQLVCVSGVHRLTSRVSSLTVTLVLTVRKAVSLVLSIVVLNNGAGGDWRMWTGASLVLAGSVVYTLGSGATKGTSPKEEIMGSKKIE